MCDEKTPHPLSIEYCYRVEEDIKKSRFITSIGRADSKEKAKFFIDKIRAEFPDATHNCWAFAVGAPKDTAHVGQSDDGEPHGTAGKPMLNMLLHGEVGECVAVVTRYYGGIKLGPGGLVRAYQGGVALAFDSLPVIKKILYSTFRISCEYAHINKVHHLVPQFEATIVAEEFDEKICYTFSLPAHKQHELEQALLNVGNGKIFVL